MVERRKLYINRNYLKLALHLYESHNKLFQRGINTKNLDSSTTGIIPAVEESKFLVFLNIWNISKLKV